MVGKWFQRAMLATLGLLGVATIGPGCAESESILFIRQVVDRQAPDCTAAAEPDGLSIGTGVLDLSITKEYQATLLVGNQIVARGSSDQLRTESSRVSLISATVRIEDVNGSSLSSYSVPITGFVDQASGTTPGFGLTTLPLIDATAASAAGSLGTGTKRLVSFVKVTGRTLGGSEVTSNEFQFVVQACSGCLVTIPEGLDANCQGTPTNTTANENNLPCSAGQDRPIPCNRL